MASSNLPPYWLTVNELDGKLAELIDVWLDQPSRLEYDGEVVWSGKHYAKWTTATCFANCRVYPETSRECVKVG